jgi:hypothetical protein
VKATTDYPPGWYDDPGAVSGRRYWDGERWTAAAPSTSTIGSQDPGFAHFLRFFGVFVLWYVATVPALGLIWLAFIFNRVGYRKRDVLMMLIPIWSAIVSVRALWRYTARWVYWPPLPGRPSRPLQQPWLSVLSAAGWVVTAALVVVGIMAAASPDGPEMSDAQWREDFVEYWVDEAGVRPDVAECAARDVGADRPYATEDALAQAIEAAFLACEAELLDR